MVQAQARRDPERMSEHTVEGPAVKRLERSRSDRMLAGVCGGLASYFEIHPAFYRVGFVVLTLLGGAGILIYLAAVLVMPDEGKTDSVVTAALRDRRDRPWPLIGLGLLAVAGAILLSRATLSLHGDSWILFLVAGAAIVWITRHGKPAATTTVGERAAEDSRRVRRFFAWVGIVLGSLLALVLICIAIFAAVVHVHVGRGVGERTYAVTSMQDLRQHYRLGVGKLRLDLSGVDLPPNRQTKVDTSVDVGKLVVVVPADATLQVHGDAQYGHVEVLGRTADGHDADRNVTQNGKRLLVLDAHVGAGSLYVERAVR
jgi:phage shock protein PspC (stress-responsive transcriptional regulator)